MADFPFFDSRNRLASGPSSDQFLGLGAGKPNWTVWIEESGQPIENMNNNVISWDINHDGQGGASCTVVMNQRVAGFDGRNLKVRAGYGSETDMVFNGRVRSTKEPAYTAVSTIVAFGTAVVRGKQRTNMGLDFSKMNLYDAMHFIDSEAGGFGEFGMIGGDNYTIHDPEDDRDTEAETNQPGYGVFGSEATWSELERTLLEPTGFVAYDNPHGHVIHRKPELRYGGDPVNYMWWWRPNIKVGVQDKDAFQFSVDEREVYNRVIAFRKTNDYGEFVTESLGPNKPKRVREFYSVYAEIDVNRTGRYQLPIGTDDVIPDFNGEQNEAEGEVARRAKMYETVRGKFEYSGPFRTWWPMDVAYIERIEHRPGSRLSDVTGVPMPPGDSRYIIALYTCLADGSINQSASKQVYSSTISGQGALRSMASTTDPGEASYRSTGLVPVAA